MDKRGLHQFLSINFALSSLIKNISCFRFETYLKQWMKAIQDLLVESEQLRIERDDFGPQVEVEYWKTRAAKFTLLVEQITSMPCKMTLVTLRAGNCKLLKVRRENLFLYVFSFYNLCHSHDCIQAGPNTFGGVRPQF